MKINPDSERPPEKPEGYPNDWVARRNYDQSQLSKVKCGLCGKWGSPDWLDYEHPQVCK